jgi:hypothetical protein
VETGCSEERKPLGMSDRGGCMHFAAVDAALARR